MSTKSLSPCWSDLESAALFTRAATLASCETPNVEKWWNFGQSKTIWSMIECFSFQSSHAPELRCGLRLRLPIRKQAPTSSLGGARRTCSRWLSSILLGRSLHLSVYETGSEVEGFAQRDCEKTWCAFTELIATHWAKYCLQKHRENPFLLPSNNFLVSRSKKTAPSHKSHYNILSQLYRQRDRQAQHGYVPSQPRLMAVVLEYSPKGYREGPWDLYVLTITCLSTGKSCWMLYWGLDEGTIPVRSVCDWVVFSPMKGGIFIHVGRSSILGSLATLQPNRSWIVSCMDFHTCLGAMYSRIEARYTCGMIRW